jgi:predicted lipoprotein with Yx(FWY)xxD motif
MIECPKSHLAVRGEPLPDGVRGGGERTGTIPAPRVPCWEMDEMAVHRLARTAAAVAVGAVLLSACGAGVDKLVGSPKPVESSSGASAEASTAVVSADGSDVVFVDGLALANKVGPGTGDFAEPGASAEARAKWLQVAAGSTFELNPLLMNGFGRVMYRFDGDTAKPSKSNCEAACAKKWPPVLVGKGATLYFEDVRRDAIGFLLRADGTRQLTIAGWPAYFYAEDEELADATGHGVDGKWFGLRPDGDKAVAATPVTRSAADHDAELFDGKDFAEGAREKAFGLNCGNMDADNTASSIKVRGKVKIWSEKDCKGKSLVVDKDIADLSTVGFDNTISSVFLG